MADLSPLVSPLTIRDAPSSLQPLLEISDNFEGSDTQAGVLRTVAETEKAVEVGCGYFLEGTRGARDKYAARCIGLLNYFSEKGHVSLSARDKVRYAGALALRGDTKGASRMLDGILAGQPPEDALNSALAVYMAMGQKEKALQILDRLPKEKDPVKDAVGRAMLSKMLDPSEEAGRRLNEILDQHPNHRDVILFRSMTLTSSGKTKEALALIQPLAVTHPQDAEVLNIFSFALFALGQWDEAIGVMDKVLAINPKDKNALGNKIAALVAKNDTDNARQTISQALGYHPHRTDWMLQGGNLYLRTHQLAEARSILTRVFALAPWSADSYIGRAAIYQYVEKNWGNALDAYDQALRYDPQSVTAKTERAWCLSHLKRYDEADREFQKLLHARIDSGSALKIFKGLAFIAWKRDHAAGSAREWLEKAKTISSSDGGIHGMSGLIAEEERNYTEAIKEYRQEAADPQYDLDGNEALSRVLIKSDKETEALEVTAAALKRHPDSARLWCSRSFALARLRRFEEGLTAAQKSDALEPNREDTLRIMGIALVELDRFVEATSVLEKAIASLPSGERGSQTLYFYYAEALLGIGKYREAIIQADAAIQAYGSRNDGIIDMLQRSKLLKIETLRRLKEDEKSSDLLRQYLREYPDDPRGYLVQADSLLAVGKADDAEAAVNTALQKNPTHGDALAYKALVLLYHHREAEAMQTANAAIAADSISQMPQLMRAAVLVAMGKADDAIPILEKAPLDSHVDSFFLRTLVSAYIQKDYYQKAEQRLLPIIQDKSHDAELDYIYGYVQVRMERPEAALPYFKRLAEKRPDDAEAVFWLLNTKAMIGGPKSPEAVLPEVQKAIGRFPNDGGLWTLYAELLIFIGRRTEAAKVLDAGQQRVPEYISLRTLRIYLALSVGDYPLAEKEIVAAIKQWPKAWEFQFARAWLLNETGRPDQALYTLDKEWNARNPNEVEPYYLKAAILAKLKRYEEAKTFLRAGRSHGSAFGLFRRVVQATEDVLLNVVRMDHKSGGIGTPPLDDVQAREELYRRIGKELKERQQREWEKMKVPLGPVELRPFDTGPEQTGNPKLQ